MSGIDLVLWCDEENCVYNYNSECRCEGKVTVDLGEYDCDTKEYE